MRSAWVAAGGVVGTLARWWVGQIFPPSPAGFPWATLIVNITGAFAMGAVGVILIERMAHTARLRGFLAIGLLGSYTTFSTMAMDGVQLIEARRPDLAAGYWIATLLLGQMAGLIGMWLGSVRVSLWKEAG